LPDAWKGTRLAPALVRWRLAAADGNPRPPWRIAFDTRGALPETSFGAVYAPGTRQNRSGRPGWYRFYLARGWSSNSLATGAYHLEVSVADIRGNEATALVEFVVVRH